MKKMIAAVLVFVTVVGAVLPAYANAMTYEEMEAQFVYGVDIEQSDVADVFNALSEYYISEYEVNIGEVLEAAGITEDYFIEILWIVLMTEESDWHIRRYGDSWLFVMLDELFDAIRFSVRYDELEYLITEIKFLVILAEIIKFVEYETLDDISYLLYDLEMFTDDDEFLDVIIGDMPRFLETLERLISEHGADVFYFNIFEEFMEMTDGALTPNLMYLDELLDGFISENLDEIAAWVDLYAAWMSDAFAYTQQYTYLEGLAEIYNFGETVTREDITAVYNELAAYYFEVFGLDFAEITAFANITNDEMIDYFVTFAENTLFVEHFMNIYGDGWVVFFIYEIFDYTTLYSRFDGIEAAAEFLFSYMEEDGTDWAPWTPSGSCGSSGYSNFPDYYEYDFFNMNHAERKHSFEVNQEMFYSFDVYDTPPLLNLYYENLSEFAMVFEYSAGLIQESVEIPPGGRFTVQLDISGAWYVDVFMLGLDDNPVNGIFSLRLTKHPLGYYE